MKTEVLKNLLQQNAPRNKYEFEDSTVELAVVLCKKAHYGVIDKMGFPYYMHPFSVCQRLKDRFGSMPTLSEKQINFACILALLHDVVEDTSYTSDFICEELQLDETRAAELKYGLDFITHNKKTMTYSQYIRKIAEADIIYPALVKFADLLDNSSLDRVILSDGKKVLEGSDFDRINKYMIAIRILRERIYCQKPVFIIDEEDLLLIDKYRTEGEKRRIEKDLKNEK